MRRRLRLVLAAAFAAAFSAVPAAQADARDNARSAAASAGVAEVPVSFRVRNVNRTPVECETDGRSYTIRGKLVGPRGQLSRARSATLYLHGLELGGFFFNFEEVRGYDFAREQARAGLTSVVVDRLGYDRSDRPNGFDSCIGGQADIANQIVQSLKRGDYRVGGAAPRFEKVAVAGHSVGGLIAQIVGYSFDDADALVVMSYSDVVVSDLAQQAVMSSQVDCRELQGSTGSRAGYTFLAPVPTAFQKAFFFAPATSRRVLNAATPRANPDPCGDLLSYQAAVKANLENIGQISVPVLLTIGLEDKIYPVPAGRRQEDLFGGTQDVSLVQVPRTGHAVTLHRTAPRFQDAVANWLLARGFAARGTNRTHGLTVADRAPRFPG